MKRIAVLLLLASSVATLPAASADDCGERLLVLSAFPGELDLLLTQATDVEQVVVPPHEFFTGSLRGNDVLLGMTGIGLRNAARATTAAIERSGCTITGVVFSGVSGGRTNIGDVTVPATWSLPGDGPSFGVDEAMMAVMQEAIGAGVELTADVPTGDPACVGVDPRAATTVTVDAEPQIIVGGSGYSSDPFGGRRLPCFPGSGDVFGCRPCRVPGIPVVDAEGTADVVPFLDPAFFADYFASPGAPVGMDAVDMETAASAAAANAHGLPFIAVRALSDGEADPLMLPGFPFQFFYYRQLAADNAARVTLAFLERWAVGV